MFQLSYLLPLGLAVIVLKAVFSIITDSKRKTTAKLHGCVPVPCTNPDELFGFGLLRSLFMAYFKQTVPSWYVQRFDAAGPHVHTVRAKLGWGQSLITRDEKNIKAVLSAQVGDWELGQLRREAVAFTGRNVFTFEGSSWKHSRSLIRAAFAREPISNLAMYEQHIQNHFLICPIGTDGWTKVLDLQPTILGLTLDIITELLLGYSVYGQNQEKRWQLAAELGATDVPDAAEFTRNITELGSVMGIALLFGKWCKFVSKRIYRCNIDIIHRYAEWFVRRRLHQMSDSKAESKPAPDEHFVLLHELSTVIHDPEQLRHEIIALLAAGQNTSAALVSWLIYYLARCPPVFNKLRASILADFGDDFDLTRTGFAELRSSKYLQFCINEALRIGSPQPSTTRQALTDTVLPSGGGPDGEDPIFVPKGTQIILNFFAMHHRADMWGSDVEEFRPERWEEKQIDWGFSRFGGGPRKCAGQQLAITEVSYIITRIVQRFDRIENMDPVDHVVNKATVTNRPGTGVIVRMHQAERAN